MNLLLNFRRIYNELLRNLTAGASLTFCEAIKTTSRFCRSSSNYAATVNRRMTFTAQDFDNESKFHLQHGIAGISEK